MSSKQISRIACTFFTDLGSYRFTSKANRDKFLKKPQFEFDFSPINVDDKGGLKRMFGTVKPKPTFKSQTPKFKITHIEGSAVDELVAIVSVEVALQFEVQASKKEFIEWAQDGDSGWKFSGRIVCLGEDSLDGTEGEGYNFS